MPSKVVVSLKCDATPRQVCMEMRKTSPREAIAKTPITSQPTRRRGWRKAISQVTVARVRPKDRPNTIGLRHDSGPSHAPPSTR